MAAKKVKDDQQNTTATAPTVDYEPAQEGGFVRVATGPQAGRYGVFERTLADGYALVKTRDEHAEYLAIPVKHLRTDAAGRR